MQFEPMLVFGAGKEAAFAADAKTLRRSLHKVGNSPLLSASDLQGRPGTLAGLHALGLAHNGGCGLAWTSWERPLRCLMETAPAALDCSDWAGALASFPEAGRCAVAHVLTARSPADSH